RAVALPAVCGVPATAVTVSGMASSERWQVADGVLVGLAVSCHTNSPGDGDSWTNSRWPSDSAPPEFATRPSIGVSVAGSAPAGRLILFAFWVIVPLLLVM